MASNTDHIKWFRDSSPYFDAHRGSTMVICLTAAALASDNFSNIISDLALLNSLGIRIVLVYGSAEETGMERPIMTIEQVAALSASLGAITADLSARLSYSRPDFPGKATDVCTVSGNFVRARPLGIIDGVDHLQTGEVRGINHEALAYQLDGGAIVLLPAMGYSPSGETFYLAPHAVARESACALHADKLIYLTSQPGLLDAAGSLISEVDLSLMDRAGIASDEETQGLLDDCGYACRHGVARCHILSFDADGALLEELFTRDGCGTQVVGHSYEQIRTAGMDDVPGILKLIEPLEASGVLVRRSRERLESEIERFYVIERDGLLISCAALYEFDTAGELACLVTHPDYRNSDRGENLLLTIESAARSRGLGTLFVLTTQSTHWFEERGFACSSIDALPAEKKDLYNYQRNSRILVKTL